MTAEDTARALLARAQRRTFALPARGLTLAALAWGERGPLVLLHHANGFSKGTWALIADRLRTGRRVIAFDARGHGDSTQPTDAGAYEWDNFAEDLAAVAAQLVAQDGGRPIALGIGHSFGGTSMIGAAARRADLFERLLLVDPVIPPAPDPDRSARPEYLDRLVDSARTRRSHWPSRAAARTWCGEPPLFARWQREALELYLLDAMHEHDDGSLTLKCPGEAAIFGGSLHLDLFALAPRVHLPARFLWAERSYFPRALYETVAASMARATVDSVDAGHLVPMERPDLVLAAAEQCLG